MKIHENKIGDFKAFPIYSLSFEWEQDGDHNPEHPDSYMYKGMPDGRIRNNSSSSIMKKEEVSKEELKTLVDEWWSNKSKDLKDKNPSNFSFTYKLHYETWCLTWFTHFTFDQGLSDEEVLRSFEEYVRRYEHFVDKDLMRPLPEGYRCLMGAEDRWRWRGVKDDGKTETKAPCRCSSCKKHGVVRIAH